MLARLGTLYARIPGIRFWAGFLAATFLFGFACACLTLSTRSLWPAVLLHLLVALGWKTLYGILSCGLAPCVLYR